MAIMPSQSGSNATDSPGGMNRSINCHAINGKMLGTRSELMNIFGMQTQGLKHTGLYCYTCMRR